MKTRRLIWTKHLRVWFDPHGRGGGGMFPTLVASRSGKNDSIVGFGPKMWPSWFKTVARYTDRDNGGIIHWDLPVGRFNTRRGKALRWFYRKVAK